MHFRPGCLVRSTVALLGVIFLPFSIWFAWKDLRHNWPSSVALFVICIACFLLAFDRSESSPFSDLDDL